MNTLIKLDQDVAQAIFGRRHDRPTISQHAGEFIARLTGCSPGTGKDLFHLGLILWGTSIALKKLR